MAMQTLRCLKNEAKLKTGHGTLQELELKEVIKMCHIKRNMNGIHSNI